MPSFPPSRFSALSSKPRRWTNKSARLVAGVSAGAILLGLFLLHRNMESSKSGASHSKMDSETSKKPVEDGSQLLAEQQDSHVSKEVKGALAGVVERPKPPGWPFDPMDYPKPKTFFDISIDGKPAGRIVFELFTKQAPKLAENFRALCTGERGSIPLGGLVGDGGPRLHYRGAKFYRVIRGFICQTGIYTSSIYGGSIEDEPLAMKLKHDKKGLLSAANMGPNTTTTHFSIVVAPSPHLNGHYPIFGQVVEGMDVVDRINALAKPSGSKDERPRLPVVVSNCGELICDENSVCKEITLQER